MFLRVCLPIALGIAWLAMAGTGVALAAPAYKHLDPETGFRTGYYRAPTPDTVPGGERIDLDALRKLMADGHPILVDVIAHVGAGPDPLDGHWQLAKERRSIPGAVWLPDVGAGWLTPQMTRFYRRNLEKLTKGDKAASLVIFCQAGCWMGWNAAKRAAEWGYTNVHWFAAGTDDWAEAGLPLEKADPVPLDEDNLNAF